MDDLEIVSACARAMGYASVKVGSDRGPGKEPFNTVWVASSPDADHGTYNPLRGLFAAVHAMALVKKFRLDIAHCDDGAVNVFHYAGGPKAEVEISDPDLNRAICLCIARLPAQQPADAAGER